MSPVSAYLGLGSNLGDRADNLRRALLALAPKFALEAVSSFYESAPAYVLDQPRFYNLVCRVSTSLEALPALRALKRIEEDLGRTAGLRFGPRLIDLDLLFYDDLILNTPELCLPHPRIAERPFVLVPLAELAPTLLHPTYGQTIAALRDRLAVPASDLCRVEKLAL